MRALIVFAVAGAIGCGLGVLLLRRARSPLQANRAAAVFMTGALLLAIAGAVLLGVSIRAAMARDIDGRFSASNLKPWFDKLASQKGLCCSFADGLAIEDVDWDTATIADGGAIPHVVYRVRINGQWIAVPPDAVVTEPNRFGRAVVWPYVDAEGVTQVRCFIAGSGT